MYIIYVNKLLLNQLDLNFNLLESMNFMWFESKKNIYIYID